MKVLLFLVPVLKET